MVHSGDVGDAVYAMPTIRALGGGHLVFRPKNYVREPMFPEKVDRIATFFASQPYILTVQYMSHVEYCTHNLDDFRAVWQRLRQQGSNSAYNLAELHLIAQKLPLRFADEKWVELPPLKSDYNLVRPSVIFSRSFRYHNNAFPWKAVYEKYKNVATFLGTNDEWQNFNGNVGAVPRIDTPTLLEAAYLISGCKLFVGNQSALFALAVSMRVPRVLEVWMADQNCWFSDQINGVDEKVERQLPDL